jgi:hypothetical protein
VVPADEQVWRCVVWCILTGTSVKKKSSLGAMFALGDAPREVGTYCYDPLLSIGRTKTTEA